jgi:hypothetical protein
MIKIMSAIGLASWYKDNIYQLAVMTSVAENKDDGKHRRLTDLITKSRDHHGKAREKSDGSRVERSNDSG